MMVLEGTYYSRNTTDTGTPNGELSNQNNRKTPGVISIHPKQVISRDWRFRYPL